MALGTGNCRNATRVAARTALCELTIATCLAGVILAQDYQEYRQAPLRIGTKAEEPKPTPVPILKQINSAKQLQAAFGRQNSLEIHPDRCWSGTAGGGTGWGAAGRRKCHRRGATACGWEKVPQAVPSVNGRAHNEDGSYTYGYEGADGSFKIETKLATGEVKGKYGYVDETGKVKVVEYGANKYGFQPSGEGITVPPPTLVDETTGKDDLLEDDDGNVPVAPRLQYVQRSHFGAAPAPSVGPAPPRVQIPNAVPVDVVYSPKQLPARPDVEYRNVGPQTFPAAAPAPEPKIRYSQPSFAPSARPQQHTAKSANPEPLQPAFPQPRPQPAVYQPRPAQGRSTSVLDQLAKDYALPQAPEPKIRYSQPSFAPSARPQQHTAKSANPEPLQPAFPQPRPQPAVYQPRPAQGRSTSVLDQLAKDYALPQGGAAPLHDITFGYY
uniref:Uncharacterized protein n=1 Tax=Anopheles culicifacies TaxID=139723 RepID=A0A182LX73_9DIPT